MNNCYLCSGHLVILNERVLAIVVEGEKDYGFRFYGLPAGYEFSTLIEDIIDVSKQEMGISNETKKQLTKNCLTA